MADLVDDPERAVLSLLPLVDELDVLEEVAKELKLDVTAEKQGNRKFILKLIMNYLNSQTVEDKEDGGNSIFLATLDILKRTVVYETKAKKNDIVEVEKNVKIKHEIDGVSETFQIHKFRDFKINGIIGNAIS